MSQPHDTDGDETSPEPPIREADQTTDSTASDPEQGPPAADVSTAETESSAPETTACDRCGAIQRADAAFCGVCGNRRGDPIDPPADVDFCPDCGTAVESGVGECPECDASIDRAGHVDCWNCGAVLVAQAVGCHACGVSVGPGGRPQPRCSACGTTASDDAVFCPQCGSLL